MNELHQELDQALRALPVGEAPVERVKRGGRRLRTRRRAGTAAPALAVIAVAVGVPTLAGNLTAHRATPADSRPVPVTDTPPPGATSTATGLATSSGVIAQGKVGAVPWHVQLQTASDKSLITYFCLTAAGTLTTDNSDKCSPAADMGGTKDIAALSVGLGNSQPAQSISGATVGSIYYELFTVAKNVPYLVVSFADGQQLKLIPVTVGGFRYVTWAAPLSMTVTAVTAHLGGPYTDNGQTVSAIPFNQAGHSPVVGLWQQPGQAARPRAQGVIGRGNNDGKSWTATAYAGPWGVCVETGAGSDCLAGTFHTTEALTWFGIDAGTGTEIGSAAPGVTRLRFVLANGTTVQVTPVTVGDERLYAFVTGKGARPVSWTAYNAAGQQVSQGKA